jgi:pyruvate formate lyase activating enzyme
MHPIRLVDHSGEQPRCRMCLRYCALGPGQAGFCRAVVNQDGVLYSTIYGLIAEYGVDPIEKKPVRCYRPGTQVLSIGSFGCNLRCDWCQNWEIAFVDARQHIANPRYTPEQVVAAAQAAGCAGIAWTYNEPSIWVDFIADCAAVAHREGLYTVLVTNGLFSSDSLRLLQPLIDVYRADFKGLDPTVYRQHAHLMTNNAILEGVQAMYDAGVHVELVTVVMPTFVERDHLARMADWIVRNLGLAVPWHLTRFVPYARMPHLPPTTIEALQQAEEIARAAGLQRVFAGDWYELSQPVRGG